jgi:hypothetical protein
MPTTSSTLRARYKKEPIPQIKLNMFFNPEVPTKINKQCVLCGAKPIVVAGYGSKTANSKPKECCEDCVIKQFAAENKIKDLECAKVFRRRMFDVQYLWVEIFLENIMKKLPDMDENGFNEQEFNTYYTFAIDSYNEFPKTLKNKLEKTWDPKEIRKLLLQEYKKRGYDEFIDLITSFDFPLADPQ